MHFFVDKVLSALLGDLVSRQTVGGLHEDADVAAALLEAIQTLVLSMEAEGMTFLSQVLARTLDHERTDDVRLRVAAANAYGALATSGDVEVYGDQVRSLRLRAATRCRGRATRLRALVLALPSCFSSALRPSCSHAHGLTLQTLCLWTRAAVRGDVRRAARQHVA